MITCTVDRTRLVAEFGKVRRKLPEARAQALTVLGHEFGVAIDRYWPRDTNRSLAGWLKAANQAELGPFSIPMIRSSRFADQWAARLELQHERARERLEFWDRIVVNRYEIPFASGARQNRGKTARWYRDAKRHRDRARKLLDAANRELARFARIEGAGGGAVVIFGNSLKRKLDLTVRHKVYGGRGRRIETPTSSYAELVNMEPHVRIVERRSRVVAAGAAQLRAFGIKRAGARFMQELGKTSDLVRSGQASFIR